MRSVKKIAATVVTIALCICVFMVGGRSLLAATLPSPSFTLVAEVPRARESPTFTVRKAVAATKKVSTSKKESPKKPALAVIASTPIPTAPPEVVAPQPLSAPVFVPPPTPTTTAPQSISAVPAPSTPTVAAGKAIIAEVSPGGESSADEYIVIYNPGQQAVELTGWSIYKVTASGKSESLVAKARFQNKTLQPNQRLVIARDGAVLPGITADIFWAKSNGLAAKSNGIVLRNATGETVDRADWAEIPKGARYVREPLMDGDTFVVQ